MKRKIKVVTSATKEAFESVWCDPAPAVIPDCDDSVDIHEAELPVERIEADVPRFSNSPVLCCFFKRRPCPVTHTHTHNEPFY